MSEAEIANRVAPEMNTIAAKTILLVFFALLLARPASPAEENADSEKADVARQNADDVEKQKADDVANDLIGAFPLSTHWGQLVKVALDGAIYANDASAVHDLLGMSDKDLYSVASGEIYAAGHGEIDIMNILLQFDQHLFRLDDCDGIGETPLMAAARVGDGKMVVLILGKEDADKSFTTSVTPANLQYRNAQVVDSIFALNCEYMTPIDAASAHHQAGAVALILDWLRRDELLQVYLQFEQVLPRIRAVAARTISLAPQPQNLTPAQAAVSSQSRQIDPDDSPYASILSHLDLNVAKKKLLMKRLTETYVAAGEPERGEVEDSLNRSVEKAEPLGEQLNNAAFNSNEPLEEKELQPLLDAKADVNFTDVKGDTPLAGACGTGSTTAVRLLLEHGADPFRVDRNCCTCIDLALEHSHEDCVQIIVNQLRQQGTLEDLIYWEETLAKVRSITQHIATNDRERATNLADELKTVDALKALINKSP